MRRIILFSLFLAATSVQAQWVQTQGPYGGYIVTVDVYNNVLFAGTEDGIYLSSNNGASWTNHLLNGLTIQCTAASGTKLFAGTSGGFFYSTDNGSSWSSSNTGLDNTNVGAIAVSGSNVFIGTSSGVYLSTNGGNWTKVSNGLTDSYVTALAISGSTILAGTQGGGIYISVNNGSLWTQSNTGYTDLYGLSFAVSGSKIFSGSSAGIFLSTDNGASWNSVSNGLPAYANINAIRFIGADVYCSVSLVGLYKSSNDGASWEEAGFNSPGTYRFAFDGSDLFVGTLGQGVFMSADLGANWDNASAGISNLEVTALTTYNNYLFAGVTKAGVFVSPDFGNTWNSNNNALNSKSVLSLGVDGINILAGIYGFAGSDGGIYRSPDMGDSWTLSGLAGISVTAIKTVGNNIFAGTDGGIYKSSDHGTTWNYSGVGSYVNSILAVGNGIFVSTGGNNAVYATFDNGANWVPKSNGLPSSGCTNIYSLAAKDSKIYATSCYGIYVSNDNGGTWTSLIQGLSGSNKLALHGENFLLSESNGFTVSHDDGQHWTLENGGLSNHAITSMITRGDSIIVGTQSGIFISPLLSVADFTPSSGTVGTTVSITGKGFDLTPSNNIVQFSNNATADIISGTGTRLTMKVPANALTGPIKVISYGQLATTTSDFIVVPVTGIDEKADDLVALYPNPFNKTIIVKSQHEVNIGIFDSLGNLVRELNSFKGEIDSSSFAAGLYLFRISNGAATKVQKLIKIY